MSSHDLPPVRGAGRIPADQIPEALTRAPFTYLDGATQVFTSDGRTSYVGNGRTTVGEWGVTDRGRFWSFWPPSYRAEYDVFGIADIGTDDVVGLRFIDLAHGSSSEGRYTPRHEAP